MTPATNQPLLAVEPRYRHVLRVHLLGPWLIVAFGAVVADQSLLRDTPLHGVPSIVVPLLALLVVLVLPRRAYGRLRYRLTEHMLQSVHGWMFHTDTLVPLVCVQHLDVTQGPLDKLFGTASLVVHTAGTHNSVVTVRGLAPQRAAEIRDIIRQHVRSNPA